MCGVLCAMAVRLAAVALWLGLAAAASAEMPARMAFGHVLDDPSAKSLGGINGIVQDTQGFMWFAGQAGLGRFDGHQLRLFPADVDLPYALNSNYIRDLAVDRDGVLWVATDGGLCRYLVATDSFNCRLPGGDTAAPLMNGSITALAVAADNTLYIASEVGVFVLHAERQSVRHIPLPADISTPDDRAVIDLTLDSNGMVWVATTNHGLMQFDPRASGSSDETLSSQPLLQQVGDKIKSVQIDHLDRLWVGTYGAGVFVLDASRARLKHFHAGDGGLSSNVVWDITEDSRGNIWLAVDQGGLVRFHEPTQSFSAQRHNPSDPSSLQTNQVRTVFEDRNGDLWLGLYPHGVNFFNRTTSEIYNFRHDPADRNSISHSSVLSILQTTSDEIWLGTEEGLNLFHPKSGHFKRYRQARYNLPAKAVLSIEQFDDDSLWLGTWSGGLVEFDRNEEKFQPIDTTPDREPSAASSLFVWDILRDRSGDMWLGTEFNGANHYDVQRQQFRYYHPGSQDTTTLHSNFVWSIAQTQAGEILFATQGGLTRLAANGEDFDQIPVASPVAREERSYRILAVYQSANGWLWVGTQDRGIFVLNANGKFIRHLGLNEGLPSLTVSGFIEDDSHAVWAGTINGLVKVEPSRWQVTVLNSDNGLVGNNFNRNAFLKDQRGRLYFGGAEGLSVFHPAKLEEDHVEFEVLVTGLRIHNLPVRVGGERAPIDAATTLLPQVRLDHRDSMVTFEFSALNFRKASAMVYAYRLDGFDEQWHHIGKNYSATYTNLPPGDYQFRVMASAGNGHWRESAPLQVSMRAAPWLTPWALVLYGVALVGLGALIASYFNLRTKSSTYRALSIQDPLTGMLNRMGVMQQAEALFHSAVGKPLCLVFIDVDRFKRINDERGHDAGDRILVDVARLIVSSVRQADVVGRWGGEEFILLCPGVHKEAVNSIVEKVRVAVAEHRFEKGHEPLNVTISLGVAYVAPGESFDSALKRADLALYQAKTAGRNCTVMADDVEQ